NHEHAALCESTGGSIEAPASFCGNVGLCPTYGRVSRYGLIDYANSLDKIGPMAKTVADTALILNFIAGKDLLDSTSANNLTPDYTSFLNKGVRGLTIGVVKQAFGEGVQPGVASACQNALERLEHAGARLVPIELPTTLTYGLPAYYVIAMSEASTNLAKYCGMRYGVQDIKNEHYNEYFTRIRTTHLGKEAKRRILLGTFARMAGHRDAYYLKAAQARTLIIKEYQRLFAHVNLIATPTMPFIAPKFKEIQELTPLQNYLADIFTVGPNLAGMPHISLPAGTSQGMPVGFMLTANHFQEQTLIQTGDTLEHTKNRT
ncbi:MAG: amidase family protein, partial [Candidatus Woesearchaeota archaeon]|nr:amidase family protein [Candidatus Woesearchaeota archaeon]